MGFFGNIWNTAVLGAVAVEGLKVFNLSESSWTLSNQQRNISVPAKLPSVAHLDLFAAGVIPDPYLGLNDFDLRWVAESNWTYASNIKGLSRDANSTWLLFNGLDTYTSITFCGEHVAATNNQFRQYWFNVGTILKDCKGNDPLLRINFGSAALIAAEIANQPGQETWPWRVEGLFEYIHRQFVRKEQSDFGWDWGPAFVPAGPWQPAYILQNSSDIYTNNNTYVRNTLVDIYREGQLPLIPPDQTKPWIMNISLDVIGSLQQGDTIAYTLTDLNGKWIQAGNAYYTTINLDTNTITARVSINPNYVDLWWPNGLGSQPLYNLRITIMRGYRMTLATIVKRVGFRTIVLNMEPIRQDQLDKGVAPGNNWHFEVNGQEFYAKGSNFIPPDAFWPRVTEGRIRSLFGAVIKGNQNMLRVWASGAYSPDFMYDVADEMGILLWSEFEFGDALYPVDKEFLDNVREEAHYQVRRVNHHPSLALWAGGNELENLELGIVNRTAPQQYDRYLAEYEKLFLDTLVPSVFENSRSISYTPSSTSNGWLSLDFSRPQPITQRYNNKTAGSLYGNTDYYNYNSYAAFEDDNYPVGRFSNEFGYHSMPSLQSWQQVLEPSDLHFNSSVIQLRNHHYPSGGLNTTNYDNSTKGMGEMTLAAERWIATPNKKDPVANFSSWCHATQLFQADYYKNQIMFYRRGSGMRERQLGSLYWQLEDIWQAPTWAGIEYDGRWKVLHYTAKDAYKNVVIAPFYNGTLNKLDVYVTSDLWSEATGTVNFTFYDWSGNPLDITTPPTIPITIGAINTTIAYSFDFNAILKKYTTNDAVLHMSTTVQGTLPNSNITKTFTHENWFYTPSMAEAKLVDPGLSITYDEKEKCFWVEAKKGIAAWVWIDYPAGPVVWFEDNGFWLKKGEKRRVGFEVAKGDLGWVDEVTVGSLWDLSQP
ncbi:putative beta-mannosidase [Tothia fuscella]|uniref:Beta-mannosidase A n=1 Tax=Tothia fuscella TaxID=1048955 RepID=A0A9P4NVK2_9PEZI|nr:putative beta-mannosidase [Tothia fuscella]